MLEQTGSVRRSRSMRKMAATTCSVVSDPNRVTLRVCIHWHKYAGISIHLGGCSIEQYRIPPPPPTKKINHSQIYSLTFIYRVWFNKICPKPLCGPKSLWLFSHESKVRNLNDHLNCAIWITQCTHERSNCDIWIMQRTHERLNCGLAFYSGRRCVARVWVPCQSNMHGALISYASVHVYICSVRYIGGNG